jgi:hypothetical protein
MAGTKPGHDAGEIAFRSKGIMPGLVPGIHVLLQCILPT